MNLGENKPCVFTFFQQEKSLIVSGIPKICYNQKKCNGIHIIYNRSWGDNFEYNLLMLLFKKVSLFLFPC